MRSPRTLILSAWIVFTMGAEAARSQEPARLERRREGPFLKKDVPRAESVAFSPDGTLLALGGSQEIKNLVRERVALLDVRTLKVLRMFDGDLVAKSEPRVIAVAVTPGNRFVAAQVLEFFPELLSARVVVWEVATGDLVGSFSALAPGRCLASSPRQPLLAYCAPDGTIQLWDPVARLERALSPRRSLTGYFEMNMAFSPDGRVLAVAERHDPEPELLVVKGGVKGGCVLKMWRVDEGREAASASLGDRLVEDLGFSPDGSALISTERITEQIDGSSVECESACTIRDAATLRERRRLPSGGSSLSDASLAVSPDGSLLVTGVRFKERLCLWDLPGGRALARPTGEETEASSLAFSPDGSVVASAGGHSGFHLWDVKTGKE